MKGRVGRFRLLGHHGSLMGEEAADYLGRPVLAYDSAFGDELKVTVAIRCEDCHPGSRCGSRIDGSPEPIDRVVSIAFI